MVAGECDWFAMWEAKSPNDSMCHARQILVYKSIVKVLQLWLAGVLCVETNNNEGQ